VNSNYTVVKHVSRPLPTQVFDHYHAVYKNALQRGKTWKIWH